MKTYILRQVKENLNVIFFFLFASSLLSMVHGVSALGTHQTSHQQKQLLNHKKQNSPSINTAPWETTFLLNHVRSHDDPILTTCVV